MGVQSNSTKILGFSKITIAIFIVWGLILIILAVAGFLLFKNRATSNSSSQNTEEGELVIEQTRPDGCIDDTIYTSIEDALETSKPEDICTLNLSNQELSELPEGIESLINLVTLGLGSNNFTSIPEELGNFDRLANVGLTKNNISTLPEDPSFLATVKIVDLSENPITTADLDAFKKALPNTEVRYMEKMPAFLQPKE